MACSNITLNQLKENYAVFEKRYSLPSFDELNREFSIEVLTETQTDFLIRGVRKILAEKVVFFSKFIEVILNPSEGGSLFIFSITKTLKQEDRQVLAGIYEKISKFEIESIKRDIDYSEEEEAVFVKKIHSFWDESKKPLLEILEIINSNWENKTGKSEKSYFR